LKVKSLPLGEELYLREIDVRLSDMVKVVGKEIDHHVGDNLGNLGIAIARVRDATQIIASHLTTAVHNCLGKRESSLRLWVA
jgi:hypothetical protein